METRGSLRKSEGRYDIEVVGDFEQQSILVHSMTPKSQVDQKNAEVQWGCFGMDTVSKEKRSEMMSRVKGRDSKLEVFFS